MRCLFFSVLSLTFTSLLAQAQSSPVFDNPASHTFRAHVTTPSPGSLPIAPGYAVAVGNWNSDITPDIAVTPINSGETSVTHFLENDGSSVGENNTATFLRTFANGSAGLERVITVDVGAAGPDGKDDLVSISSAGTISLSQNLGTELDQATGLTPAILIDELSQSFPNWNWLGGDQFAFFPVAKSINLPDGDNFQDLVLGGIVTDANFATVSTGLIIYRGVPNGYSSTPIHIPSARFIVDAKFLDMDSTPGAETLAVLGEIPPPSGYYSSIAYSYVMTFYQWNTSQGTLSIWPPDQSHPYGTEHTLSGSITGRIQAFDAALIDGDNQLDFVFVANPIFFGQRLTYGDAYILWGNPNSGSNQHRLETFSSTLLPPSPNGLNLSGYVSVRVADVSDSPGPEIVVLEERNGDQFTPIPNAEVLVFEGIGQSWVSPPRVTDLGAKFIRRLSSSYEVSWGPTIGNADALQLADLDCDSWPELIVGGVKIPHTSGPDLDGVQVLKNTTTLQPGQAKCESRETGTPFVISNQPLVEAAPPRVTLTTAEPRVNTPNFGIRISGTRPGTYVFLIMGYPIQSIPYPPYGFNLLIAPASISGMMVTQSQAGDPPNSAWAEYPGWLPNNPGLVGASYSLGFIYYDPVTDRWGNTAARDIVIGQ